METIDITSDVADKKLVERIIPPHKKLSREVTQDDIGRVIEDSVILWELCFQPVGLYAAAFAMAHPQIDDKDPLRMFVTADRRIIINPVISNKTKFLVDSKEGCMTYPKEKILSVKRARKCDVEYVTIMLDPEDDKKFKLSSMIKETLTGNFSFVFQHEVDHLDGRYIYDDIIKERNEKDNLLDVRTSDETGLDG